MAFEVSVALVLVFTAVVMVVWVGIDLFSKGWTSYESKYVEGAEQSLDGMYITMPAQHVFYISVIACIAAFCFGVLISDGEWLVGLPMGLLAFSAPQITLKVLKKRRHSNFAQQLVDALDSMGNALKAGLSLPQAFDLVHTEMDNPIKQEFKLLTHELKFGVRTEDALIHLQERMENADLDLMSTAITVAQEVGGNLSDVFGNIAATIRERNRIEDKIKALTGQGKMQGVVLCLLPFAIGGFLAVVYPDMMRPFFTSVIGLVLIGLIFVLIALGGFFIKKIVDIDV